MTHRKSVGGVPGRPAGGGGLARSLRGRESVRSQVPAAAQPSVEAERRRADTAELRELATGEARRLRDATDRPDYERRELLEDLGSRLAVLGIGVLRALAERLTPGGDRGPARGGAVAGGPGGAGRGGRRRAGATRHPHGVLEALSGTDRDGRPMYFKRGSASAGVSLCTVLR